MKNAVFAYFLCLLVLTAQGQTANDYREAAGRGNADAQYNYGRCYYEGLGVPRDCKQAVYWLTKSAEQGNTDAEYLLAECHYHYVDVQDEEKSLSLYQRAAAKGHPEAQLKLGILYNEGYTINQDFSQAAFWYSKAAEQGNSAAQYKLSCCYYYGIGVKRDVKKAKDLATKAFSKKDNLKYTDSIWCAAILFQISKNESLPSASSSARKRISIPENIAFDMILVKPGSFIMGATPDEIKDEFYYKMERETPSHRVTITKSYYIGETEVTQGLFTAVMGYNPTAFFDAMGYPTLQACPTDAFPVGSVSYSEALVFCEKLSKLTGMTFTLPTEAQWEYAARGGHKASRRTLYPGSNTLKEVVLDPEDISPVGITKPNELGLYEMCGNIIEHCLDWYGPYTQNSQVDPKGPTTGEKRVIRGMCDDNGLDYDGRTALRYGYDPNDAGGWMQGGFRIVMIP